MVMDLLAVAMVFAIVMVMRGDPDMRFGGFSIGNQK